MIGRSREIQDATSVGAAAWHDAQLLWHWRGGNSMGTWRLSRSLGVLALIVLVWGTCGQAQIPGQFAQDFVAGSGGRTQGVRKMRSNVPPPPHHLQRDRA